MLQHHILRKPEPELRERELRERELREQELREKELRDPHVHHSLQRKE
jgi:1,6-anhydro-N-acetylmuramate kinase